jgi:hypothetical protein
MIPIAAVCIGFCLPPTDPLKGKFDRVKIGMTMDEVWGILGRAKRETNLDTNQTMVAWESDFGFVFVAHERNGTIYGKDYEKKPMPIILRQRLRKVFSLLPPF